MVELTLTDLRSATDLGRAALDVRTPEDVGALLRRLRHVVPCQAVVLHQIHPPAMTHWAEPGAPPDGCDFRLDLSDTVEDSVVHLTMWRCDEPFSVRDHQLMNLVRPYLASAVVIVGHGVEVDLTVSDDVDLTNREAQVLSLITDGATNKEVGRQLGISARTVQKHLEHIYGKLGTHRRTAAANWFSNQLARH